MPTCSPPHVSSHCVAPNTTVEGNVCTTEELACAIQNAWTPPTCWHCMRQPSFLFKYILYMLKGSIAPDSI